MSRQTDELVDLGALLGHIDAALAVIDRMNARAGGTVTTETRRALAHITGEVDQRIGDLLHDLTATGT